MVKKKWTVLIKESNGCKIAGNMTPKEIKKITSKGVWRVSQIQLPKLTKKVVYG